MTVAVDIGNTNIVVAVEKDGQWNKPFRVFTDTKKTLVLTSSHSPLRGGGVLFVERSGEL